PGPARVAVGPGPPLDLGDRVESLVQRTGEHLVHGVRIVAFHQVGLVAVPGEQVGQLVVADPCQHRRVGDLVPVEVQDRQYRAVPGRVEKLVGVPRGSQRAGLGFAVADYAGDHQVRVVERGAVRVGEGVAELAALVDGAGRLGRDVAGHATGERELGE